MIAWTDEAWADYVYWQSQDKKTITHTEALKALDDMFSQAADAPDMTLDEINAEIAKVRANKQILKK